MDQKPKIMNIGNMVMATENAKHRIKSILELADSISKDARKVERLAKNECKSCFYGSRIGGSAMTTRPCMSCGESLLYSSTNTDVLCLKCAIKHELCKHCGGDLNLRSRRKTWPKPDKD